MGVTRPGNTVFEGFNADAGKLLLQGSQAGFAPHAGAFDGRGILEGSGWGGQALAVRPSLAPTPAGAAPVEVLCRSRGGGQAMELPDSRGGS